MQPVRAAEGYLLDQYDPGIYTDCEDLDGFNPRKEWPDKLLSWKQQPSTITTTPSVQDNSVQPLLKVHHLHADILKSNGVDACKEYEERKIKRFWTVLLKISRSVLYVDFSVSTHKS